jgi:hypothetical protein
MQQVSYGVVIQTILDYHRRSRETSRLAQTDKHYKSEETKVLVDFIVQQKFETVTSRKLKGIEKLHILKMYK